MRAGPVRDYLPLAESLPNFSLRTDTKVLRAIRDGSSVTGIEVELAPNARQIINLKPGGAVILAAGALSTPRLLFNSGIGPKEQLETVASGTTRIELPPQDQWLDLPAGQHLKDHPIFTVKFNTRSTLETLPDSAWLEPDQETIDLYARGSGLLAQSGQRINFFTSINTSNGTDRRYVQGTVNAPQKDVVRAKVYLTHGATSEGSLGITPAGATVMIREPLMNTDADRAAILAFMGQLVEMASKPNSTLTLPEGTTAQSLVEEFVSGSHFVGTARMGEVDDGSSVVDTETRVWGMENLYVVDASIHPHLPTGNTQAPVMVVAERAAEVILGSGGEAEPECETRRM